MNAACAQGWSAWLDGPKYTERLRAEDPQERIRAAHELETRGSDDYVTKALSEALRTETEPNVRHALVRAVAFRGGPDAVSVLDAAVGSSQPETAKLAAGALAMMGMDGLRLLMDAFRVEATRAVAAEALVEQGSVSVALLTTFLPSSGSPQEDPELVLEAVRSLGKIGDSSATIRLKGLLSSRDPKIRAAAVMALGQIGDERVIRDVREKLHDGSSEVMIAAKHALEGEKVRAMGTSVARGLWVRVRAWSKEDAQEMRWRLRAADAGEVCSAANALAQMKDRQSWRAMVSRLDAPVVSMRLCVAKAVGALASSHAAPLLQAYARVEQDPVVRRAILDAALASLAGIPRPVFE